MSIVYYKSIKVNLKKRDSNHNTMLKRAEDSEISVRKLVMNGPLRSDMKSFGSSLAVSRTL